MKQRILSLALSFTAIFQLRADEGMWPLTLLQKIQDPMQARGLKLSADDIYAVNHASVKDAIVRLMSKQGRMFCTGEVISSQGLFLTNHHCGYGAIQELSTNEERMVFGPPINKPNAKPISISDCLKKSKMLLRLS